MAVISGGGLEAVALRLAKSYGGEVETQVGEELLATNVPVIHAVGRASHRPPRLIELRWGDPAHPHVVVAGKGHETGQIIGTKTLPFSDRDAVRAALEELAA